VTTDPVDEHDPDGMAAWLRKRAEENRRVAELPPQDWPRNPGVLQHLALRFEQAAAMVEKLSAALIAVRDYDHCYDSCADAMAKIAATALPPTPDTRG
jgi:hypothetical protein